MSLWLKPADLTAALCCSVVHFHDGCFAFSALTLSVGRQEEHPAYKN